jgi:Subtilase family
MGLKMETSKIPPLNSIDPYLLWARDTNFRDYNLSVDEKISVLVKWPSGQDLPTYLSRSIVYEIPVPNQINTSILTGQITKNDLDQLIAEADRVELGQVVEPVEIKNNFDLETFPPGKRVVVGVIDDFIGFANNSLSGKFKKIWCQDKRTPSCPSGQVWEPCKRMGYGTELTEKNLGRPLSSADYPFVQSAYTHGSHVAGAAIHPDAVGIGVHLPSKVLRDTSGGAMAVQILDGVRYILSSAGPKDHIVINVSYGTYAGPHDGNSLLELALDELIKAYDGRLQIVFPSGNQYESRTHIKLRLDGQGAREKRLRWRVLPDDRTPSFVELWMMPQDANTVSIELKSPSGRTIGPINLGEQTQSPFTIPCEITAALYFPKSNAMSAISVGALIALAPTASTNGAGFFAEHGMWEILISSTEQREKFIAIYVERDDNFGRPVRGKQSYFVDSQYERTGRYPGQTVDDGTAFVMRDGSVNTVVNGQFPISVGAYLSKERRASSYSGAGSSRLGEYRPHVMAVGDDSIVRAGKIGCGVFGNSRFRMNGTSVAAPQVTRQIAQQMLSATSTSVATSLPVLATSSASRSSAKSSDQREALPKLSP